MISASCMPTSCSHLRRWNKWPSPEIQSLCGLCKSNERIKSDPKSINEILWLKNANRITRCTLPYLVSYFIFWQPYPYSMYIYFRSIWEQCCAVVHSAYGLATFYVHIENSKPMWCGVTKKYGLCFIRNWEIIWILHCHKTLLCSDR